ncbi:MAG: acyl-CoA dehydrogenase family protein [Acidimicrobiales bacterium]
MDPSYSADAEAYRAHIRSFLQEHLPAGWRGIGRLEGEARSAFLEQWRELLSANGLLAVAWPKIYGGAGLSAIEQVIINEEFARAGAPTGGPNDGFGIGMLGPTIMAVGSEEQKRTLVPRILSGQDRWCQGYSEPDAGSDLANLGCRAELDGEQWVINGQKIWTSQAQSANWIFLLVRSRPEAPKHQGITFLLVPMDQPGIEVRPIINIARGHEFNEVYFTDARTAAGNVLGEVHNGWMVANTLLGFERGGRSTVLSITYREELDRLLAAARARGATLDPHIRQRLAWCHSKVEIMRYLGMRSLTQVLAGQQPGPQSSIFKLLWSEYHREATQLALDILGPEAMTPSGRRAAPGIAGDAVGAEFSTQSWVDVALRARSGTIYAGTSQVQRNILGERVLGLPKEPRADEGPWGQRARG